MILKNTIETIGEIVIIGSSIWWAFDGIEPFKIACLGTVILFVGFQINDSKEDNNGKE